MNCTRLALTWRMVSARCSIWVTFWMFVNMLWAAIPTTEAILVVLVSRPFFSMPCTSEDIRNWSRWMRCRSEPSPRPSRVRQKASASRPQTWCRPRFRCRPDMRVVDGRGQADADPAQVVDDLLEAGEGQLEEVVDADVRGLLNGLPQAAGAAIGERGVDLLDLAWLGGLPGRAALGRAGQDRHHGVAREAQHHRALGARRDVHHHDRVRALAGDPTWPPIFPFLPLRLSEPISSRFSAWGPRTGAGRSRRGRRRPSESRPRSGGT